MQFSTISLEFSLSDFDCSNELLNSFLKNQALQNQERRLGATTLLINNNRAIIGYYTLCACHIDRLSLPKNFGGHLPSQIPAIRLARLAVDKKFQNNGYGRMLLAHSLRTAYYQSEMLGGYVILIDVKPTARKFYQKYGMKVIKDSAEELIMGLRTKEIPSYFTL